MVLRQNGYHGPTLPDKWVTTQVGLVSPTLFKVVAENVIRTWLAMIVEDQRVDHNGIGDTIGRCLGVFYADDGMVGSIDTEWLQHSINVLVGLF